MLGRACGELASYSVAVVVRRLVRDLVADLVPVEVADPVTTTPTNSLASSELRMVGGDRRLA